MAISYIKLSEKQEEWGIDVTVNFQDKDVDVTKTFRFENEKQIDLEFDSRMVKAISNIEDDIAESKKLTSDDIVAELEKYFETNTIITKEEYDEMKTTEITRLIYG